MDYTDLPLRLFWRLISSWAPFAAALHLLSKGFDLLLVIASNNAGIKESVPALVLRDGLLSYVHLRPEHKCARIVSP